MSVAMIEDYSGVYVRFAIVIYALPSYSKRTAARISYRSHAELFGPPLGSHMKQVEVQIETRVNSKG